MWTYNHTNSSNELYHYGVPGMKWGVRRAEKRAQKLAAKKAKRDKYLSEREEDLKDETVRAHKASKALGTVNNVLTAGEIVCGIGALAVAGFGAYTLKHIARG